MTDPTPTDPTRDDDAIDPGDAAVASFLAGLADAAEGAGPHRRSQLTAAAVGVLEPLLRHRRPGESVTAALAFAALRPDLEAEVDTVARLAGFDDASDLWCWLLGSPDARRTRRASEPDTPDTPDTPDPPDPDPDPDAEEGTP